MSVRLYRQALPLRLLPSAECSAHLAKNSSFFGLSILESRSQRSATIDAYSLQHRDDGKKGGPLRPLMKIQYSGVAGSGSSLQKAGTIPAGAGAAQPHPKYTISCSSGRLQN